jgi:tRNA A37 threonylcarbamoyladenosine synthetase subunit TsaC/SUA5/YrdC
MQEEASVAGVLPRQLRERLLLTHPADAETAAQALAGGAIVGHGFANFYAITTRPDAETIRSVNLLKGRPPTQVGSITTTPSRIATVWDFDRLPKGLAPHDVLTLVDTLFMIGPFGFRGPAADRVPNQLTQLDGDIRTAQVIAPGYACPSNDFLARALRAAGGDYLYITSANRSRHETGAADEPAHYRADGLRHAFGRDAGSYCWSTRMNPPPAPPIRRSPQHRRPSLGSTGPHRVDTLERRSSSSGTGHCPSSTHAVLSPHWASTWSAALERSPD